MVTNRLSRDAVGVNACWLYLRLAVETTAEIVVVRILLSTLGVDGYGVFAAASGCIGAFGFFLGALEAATRRFVCCDPDNFPSALGVSLLLATLVGVAGSGVCVGLTPFPADVSLPILGVVLLRLLRIPYETCVMADERMGFFFVLSLVEAVLTVASAVLAGLASNEPVATYALLRLATFLAATGIVWGYSLKNHPVSRSRPAFRCGALKELSVFFGWQALGSVAGLLKGNGLVALLMAYVGVSGCAASDAAGKFAILLWGLIANYRMAYLPGIVKAWAANDRHSFTERTRRPVRLSLIGMTAIALPLWIWAPEACRLSLGATVPADVPMFVRMIVLQFYSEALATPLDTAILTTGRIARYQITLTALLSSSFFLAWGFLAAGLPAWTTVGAVAIVNVAALGYRVCFLRQVQLPDGTQAW